MEEIKKDETTKSGGGELKPKTEELKTQPRAFSGGSGGGDDLSSFSAPFAAAPAGQHNTQAGALIPTAESEDVTIAPDSEITTVCGGNALIGFAGLHILRGFGELEAKRVEYPNFDENTNVGFTISNNGLKFARAVAGIASSHVSANNSLNGEPFIVQFVVSGDMFDGTLANWIGLSSDPNADALNKTTFAIVVRTEVADRVVELQEDGVFVAGTRATLAEGDEVQFVVFPTSVAIYHNGEIVGAAVEGSGISCRGQHLVFFAGDAGATFGGKIDGLTYAIETAGGAEAVGTIDAVTGQFQAADESAALIEISGTLGTAVYTTYVRVVRPATIQSMVNALVEGAEVDLYFAELTRMDTLPLRLYDGRPDKNQIKNPVHAGILQGALTFEPTVTRNEFRNDRGATSTKATLDKIVATGAYLEVRDWAKLRRFVPYLTLENVNGTLVLTQKTSGCKKQMRMIAIWRNPSCDATSSAPFEAIEFVNAESYSFFRLALGSTEQSNIPISIEAFPDPNGVIFKAYQYDAQYSVIG